MKKIVKRTLLGLLAVTGVAILAIAGLNLYVYLQTPKNYLIDAPSEFAYQPGFKCSGFSSAYVLRSLGDEAEEMTLYNEISDKNPDGTVSPEVLVQFLKEKGYAVKLCAGTLMQLEYTVLKGTPVIVLVRVSPKATAYHYLPIVGYDQEQIFAAESLSYMVNEEKTCYNRSIAVADFEQMWDTPVAQKKHIYYHF